MPVEVTYPKVYHKCFPSEIDGGYLFICEECTYRRKMSHDKIEVLDKGDRTVAHYGDAGVCEMLETSQQLRTALNDAAARCQMDNDGLEVPKSFG